MTFNMLNFPLMQTLALGNMRMRSGQKCKSSPTENQP